MAQDKQPLYLERASYRRGRLLDALRLLPFFVLLLWMLPLFGDTGASSLSTMLYIFGVWSACIVISFVLNRHLRRTEPTQTQSERSDAEL